MSWWRARTKSLLKPKETGLAATSSMFIGNASPDDVGNLRLAQQVYICSLPGEGREARAFFKKEGF